jgi:hypothetical protein
MNFGRILSNNHRMGISNIETALDLDAVSFHMNPDFINGPFLLPERIQSNFIRLGDAGSSKCHWEAGGGAACGVLAELVAQPVRFSFNCTMSPVHVCSSPTCTVVSQLGAHT